MEFPRVSLLMLETVARKSYIEKVFHRKISEFCLNKFTEWRPATLLKKDFDTDFFMRNLRNFPEHLFCGNLQTTAFLKRENS